jgi:hypothetical protein
VEAADKQRTQRGLGEGAQAGVAGAQGVDHGEQLSEWGGGGCGGDGGGVQRLEGLAAAAAGGAGPDGRRVVTGLAHQCGDRFGGPGGGDAARRARRA